MFPQYFCERGDLRITNESRARPQAVGLGFTMGRELIRVTVLVISPA